MAKANDRDSEKFLKLEQNLQQVLRPVQPRGDFVERFGKRLSDYPQISIESRRPDMMLPLVVSAIFLLIPFSWLVWRYMIKPLLGSGEA